MAVAPQVTVGGFTKPTGADVVCYLDGSGNPVAVTALTPLPMTTEAPVSGVTYVDGSGTIAAGGTAQTVFAANAARVYLFLLNVSDTDMWVNFGIAAVANQPSIRLAANGGYLEPLVVSGQSVSVICATTGKAFVAKQG